MKVLKYVIACMFIMGCASVNPDVDKGPVVENDSGPNVADSGPADSGPYVNPYADAGPGTCVGHCGDWDPETLCACDELCESWGDCCPDKAAVCGDSELPDAGPGEFPGNAGPENPGSCEGRCGEHSQQYDCQCDALCHQYGDCCGDKEDVCGPIVEECENDPRCHAGETGVSTHCSENLRHVNECKDADNDGCLEMVYKKTCATEKVCITTAEYNGENTVAFCVPKPKPENCNKPWKKEVCFTAGHSDQEVCVCVSKNAKGHWG